MVMISKLDDGFTKNLPPDVKANLEQIIKSKDIFFLDYLSLLNIFKDNPDLVKKVANAYLGIKKDEMNPLELKRLNVFEKFATVQHDIYTNDMYHLLYVIINASDQDLNSLNNYAGPTNKLWKHLNVLIENIKQQALEKIDHETGRLVPRTPDVPVPVRGGGEPRVDPTDVPPTSHEVEE